LLQKLRDSTSIASYARYLSEKEPVFRELASRIHDFLATSPNHLHVAYHRYGYLPASIIYWFTVTMDPGRAVTLHDSIALTHYILPYSEQSTIMFFTSNPYSVTLLSLAQTSTLLGNNLLVVTQTPRDERVKNLLSRYRAIYVDAEDELEAMLVASIAAYYAMSRFYSSKLGARGARLSKHAEEGLAAIVGELVEKYLDNLDKLLQSSKWFVTSTKMLEPVALFFTEVLRRLGVESYYQTLDHILGYSNTLLLSTSVEEFALREYRFKYSVMGVKLNEITLNTDPLEAQIYIALLAYYLIHCQSRG